MSKLRISGSVDSTTKELIDTTIKKHDRRSFSDALEYLIKKGWESLNKKTK